MENLNIKFKIIIIFVVPVLLANITVAYAKIKIDGRIGDWANIPTVYKDKKGDVESTRSGMDFLSVSMKLEKEYLYVLMKGRSLTAGKPDDGTALSETSIRISFVPASNPLNRLRIATDTKNPGMISISKPSAKTKDIGDAITPYWMIGKIKGGYGIELKIPVVRKNGNVYVYSSDGPVIKKQASKGKRRRICDMFVTNVNTKTHLFIDKADFYIYDTTF